MTTCTSSCLPNLSMVVSAISFPNPSRRPPNTRTSVSPGPRLVAVMEWRRHGVIDSGDVTWRHTKNALSTVYSEQMKRNNTCTDMRCVVYAGTSPNELSIHVYILQKLYNKNTRNVQLYILRRPLTKLCLKTMQNRL